MAAPIGNKYAEGNNGGRPPIHTDPAKVNEMIEQYFEYIKGEYKEVEKDVEDENGNVRTIKIEEMVRPPQPPTVTGLSLALNFCSKSTLYDYAEKEEFSHSIKRAIMRIEQYHEQKIAYGDKCTGNIFALKNFGWTDSQSVDITSKGKELNLTPVYIEGDKDK